jgi:hypothetical protein
VSAVTATVIIAAIGMIVSFAAMIWVTVTLRQSLREMSHDHTIMNQRHEHQINRYDSQMAALLDRLTTIKWEDYVALRSIQDDGEVGGFLTPEQQAQEVSEDTQVMVQEPGRWGPLSRQRQAETLSDTEKLLLEEDFPEKDRSA